jgi:3,4-dihydroxy 2-butanone 4-phosphate synthase/GTP cyclohydrolase II
MMRGEELRGFAKEHKLLHITIADLIRYRRKHEKLVRKVSEARLPTEYGTFTAYVYESLLDGIQHLAMVMGDPKEHESFLVRVHSECLTGDIFHSTRCDCGTQLDQAFRRIAEQGAGALIYLRGHEGRGIGIAHKLRAYQLQDAGRDTVDANLELGLPADSREYGIGAQMLVDLGVSKLRLLTNNPSKYGGLEGFDLEIVERVPIVCTPTEENRAYLETKQARMGHLLGI